MSVGKIIRAMAELAGRGEKGVGRCVQAWPAAREGMIEWEGVEQQDKSYAKEDNERRLWSKPPVS